MIRPREYDKDFYLENAQAEMSASIVVPEVLSIIPAKRVVDVGCGAGSWTDQFLQCGVEQVLAIDGSWVDPSALLFPRSHFMPQDLERPLEIPGRFDLAVSLEVAEHLSSARARGFVSDLTSLAPIVLFSAAVPRQGGVRHINEQWPEYWAELFKEFNYRPLDCLRKKFWADNRIQACYRQNILLFIDEKIFGNYEHLASAGPLNIVHPQLFLEPRTSMALLSVPAALGRSLKALRSRIRSRRSRT